MESKTEKTEKEESSSGMNTCISICKFSEDEWRYSPGSHVASASLGGQKKFIIKDKKTIYLTIRHNEKGKMTFEIVYKIEKEGKNESRFYTSN